MDTRRIWYCSCTGEPLEVPYEETLGPDEEPREPACPRCGATPSSDPRRTMSYRDVEDYED